MRFGSVCSGIEAASVASASLGWEAAWFSEIEPFPSAVLAHHHPSVANLGDMTLLPKAIRSGEVEAPDILVGGTPCQAFSVAGNRKGLEDARGNLTLTFCEIADAIDEVRHERNEQPSIIFWENVPGVLSDKSNAFGCFLAELAGEEEPFVPPAKWTKSGIVVGAKRTIAWRTLDAQYFGLAQRRQRVFVIASAREDINPAEILLEFGGVRRDIKPSREAGQGIAGATEGGACGSVPIAFAQNTRDELRYVGGDGSIAGALAAQPGMKQTTYAIVGACGSVGYRMTAFGEYAGDDSASTTKARDYKDATDLVVVGADLYNGALTGDVASTITAWGGCPNASGPKLLEAVSVIADTTPKFGEEVCVTMRANGGGGIVPPSVAVGWNGDHTPKHMAELAPCMRAGQGGEGYGVAYPIDMRRLAMPDTLLYLGINQGDYVACEKKAHPREVLRTLWNEVGEEATTLWGLGVFNTLREKEVLRSRVYGESLRPTPLGESGMVYSTLSCSEDCSTWVVQSLREAGRARCASQGWEPSKQLLDQLGTYMQELSQPGTSATQVLHDLWESTKGTGVLRETLSAIQEMGGRPNGEEQSTHSRFVVRRLTVTECERLMGFPDGYTNIPWRGKPESPDSLRYKALGNSWAVPCVAWIFKRIDKCVKP